MADMVDAMLLHGKNFRISMMPMAGDRLHCTFDLSGRNEKTGSAKFADSLNKSRGDVRSEAGNNICGTCPGCCIWDGCISVPFTEFQEQLIDIWNAAKLIGECKSIRIDVVVADSTHEFRWTPDSLRADLKVGIRQAGVIQLETLRERRGVLYFDYRPESSRTVINIAIGQGADILAILAFVCEAVMRR
jgi:hypothetical protein